MNLTEQATLSFYRPVADIRAEHGVSLVQHTGTGKFYVQKRLTVYNREVFEALQAQPVPNTPRIYALSETGAMLTVIEEYLPGDSLQELLDRQVGTARAADAAPARTAHPMELASRRDAPGVFSEPQVVSIAIQLTGILCDLHHRTPAIVHRDIKPSNVILSPDGVVKLLDFNAAKFVTEGQNRDTVLLGTSGYAAPEQYGFASSGEQTDLYSIGVLMNVLLTGELPSVRLADGSLRRVIARCTQLDPKNRFPDADTLYRALDRIRSKMENTPSTSAASHSATTDTPPRSADAFGRDDRPGAFSDMNTSSTKKSWRRFLPPGFRSNNGLHMTVAVAFYSILFYFFYDVTIEADSLAEQYLYRLGFCAATLAVIFFTCDYLSVQSHLPLTKSPHRIIRAFGILLYDAAILLVALLVMIVLYAIACG